MDDYEGSCQRHLGLREVTRGMGGVLKMVNKAGEQGCVTTADVFPKVEGLLKWHELH